MAVTYSNAVKEARLNAVISAIGASGKLEIGSAGMASVLATIALANPAGTASGGTLTFTLPASDLSADNGGTAAEARIRTGANADVVTGLTVGTSGADIILDSVSITAGQAVTIVSGSIAHA
jgi:hypothetical protein